MKTREANTVDERPVAIRRGLLSIPTLISFALALSFILFLVTRFDLDWGATWDNVRDGNIWLYLSAIASYYLSFLFRGIRWRMMAENAQVHRDPGAHLPSVLQSSKLILLGWFANAVTWFRLGDAYRAYAFAQESKGSFPRIMGTVLAERILDMVSVFGLLVVGAFLLISGKDISPSPIWLVVSLLMALALAALLILMRLYGLRLARLLPNRLQEAYHSFHQGTLDSLRSRLPMLAALGLMGWFLEVARLALVFQALGLEMNLPLIIFVALAHALLTALPITPGGLGLAEPGMVGILLLSLNASDAVSVALVDRSITYVSIIVFGGSLFLARHLFRPRSSDVGSGLFAK